MGSSYVATATTLQLLPVLCGTMSMAFTYVGKTDFTSLVLLNKRYNKGEGYSRVEMSFNGSLNIKQTGHAMLHIDEYDEDYLIPFLNFKVRGFVTGSLYPEIEGTYCIIASSGFLCEIRFSGRGLFSGTRNSMQAMLYRTSDMEKSSPPFIIRGQWSGTFTIFAADESTVIETWWPEMHPPVPLQIPDVTEQDLWETRRARERAIASLRSGDLGTASKEKSKLEEAQRVMRRAETQEGRVFEPLFFKSADMGCGYPLFDSLAEGTGWVLEETKTKGVWLFDKEKAMVMRKSFRNNLTLFG